MKEKILLLLYISCSVVFAQQQNFTVNWESSKQISGGSYSLEIPSFNEENFSFGFDEGLQFVAQFAISNTVNEASITVSNVSYASISKNDLKDLDINTIPNQLTFSLKNSVARDKQFAVFQLVPIIKETNGTYKKVTSFQINYTSGGNSNRISSLNKISSTNAVTNSVLSTGEWFRFYVDTTGVFKLSKSFLQRLGVKVNDVDPRTIKLYGNGGGMIPYSNAVAYPFDVEENAIKFVGEADGVFNNEDYILFYAEGPRGYNSESITNINCYTDKTYYYINVSSGTGKRIQPFVQPSGNVDLVINSFEDYKFHEVDEYNIALLGRRWFGDRFDVDTNKTFNFDFPDLVTTTPIRLKVYVAAVSSTQTSMKLTVNGAAVSTMSISGASSPSLANESIYNNIVNVSTPKITVGLNYDKQGNPSALGYLDFISIEATRALNFSDKQFQFKNSAVSLATGIGQYTIANASQLSEVWDVTDIYNVSNTLNTDAAPNFTFTAAMGVLKTYVAVTSKDYFEPKFDSKTTISNQNIKGTVFLNNQGEFQDVDYIIVAPDNMLTQAERLAQINRNQYNLNVKVYGLDEIYNEFSTGNQDIGAIRNLVKYVYDNASAPEKRIKYLCLFGDGSFDYKDRVSNNTNIVPTWHSYGSFNLTSSFVSDDFYGMMDTNEGTLGTSDRLDIAVGRVLADTPQRAKGLVDKVVSYYDKESFGSWRNNFVVVSDDVDKDWEGILEETTDNIGNLVSTNKPFMNVVKIHSDAYKQETSAGGNRYPQVTTEFVNAIDNGALVINYFGHGGEDGLAQERILLKTDIEDFRNFNKYNCFVTVTCEFTKFDNPYKETAGEFTYWNKQAGAIGLITTTRQIFVSFAISFNNLLGQYLFSYSDDDAYADYEYPSMAEALRLAKNNPSLAGQSQNRLIFFIGDPAMKLAFPKPNIQLTKINDLPIAQSTDTLKALSYVKLAGEVTDISGNLLTDYSGTLSVTIYDKDIDRQTLANDGTTLNGSLVKLDFKTLGEIIFRGQASVKNGQFEFDFVVPKDISIPVGFGKVSFYSKNEALLDDQAGASVNTVKIGGLNSDAEEDNIGPVITLYMNDENFVSGGITNESPTLLAKLEDANGINTASGVGHDIVAILDGDETNPYVLNDYYQTEVDDYQKGVVSFPFRDLEPGLHTLTIKAWDVYNNSSISEIQFIVYDEDEVLQINNVLNYPNPFVNYTEFWFNHNSSTSLNVSIQIFTVSGKLVRTLNGQTSGGNIINSSLSRDIVWDGRDDFGDRIGKGVYIYKLTVQSDLLNKKVEKIEKLVIL
ncbi:putative secreted protein (Por secretion system target) [Mariniflexile fucanivorans]|uniref:Putative secreted protein (Por secretion system target) n=1 Tax=Mariniflexile fucanivorans TaxID=264023 RepID=A0A4R1RQK7_9FLAO|nr:type IX secretion system sortase PorU [Mariniflexile fucanivorans]TCL68675.1 putative secreted protein (Por secretion system target) [Mariniflexile fucanivorans]